jgi:Cu/Ag efflux pump CusA
MYLDRNSHTFYPLSLTAVGGMNITTTIEGRERYPVNVRYFRDYRSSLEALKRVLVPTPAGAQVPMAQVADIRLTTGTTLVRSKGAELLVYPAIYTIWKWHWEVQPALVRPHAKGQGEQ